MRRPSWVRKSGPYKVSSLSNGQLRVIPRWPQYSRWSEDEGGGPGISGRMGLASDLQAWLNAPYTHPEMAEAKTFILRYKFQETLGDIVECANCFREGICDWHLVALGEDVKNLQVERKGGRGCQSGTSVSKGASRA